MVGCCITVVTADVVKGSVINKVQNAYILMGTGEVRATWYGVRYCKVIFLYSETSRQVQGSSQPPIQWVPVFLHGDKAAGARR